MSLIKPKAFFFDFYGVIIDSNENLRPGITDLIEKLDDRLIPLAVVSSSSQNHIESILQKHELDRYFQFIVSTDHVRWTKPHPEPYEIAYVNMCDEIPDLKKEECWALEDSPSGIESVKGAGLNALGITFTSPADTLSQADQIVAGFTDIEVA